MPRVVTEFDVDLAKEQVKIAEIKAHMKEIELAAKQIKLGENIVSSQASAEIAKVQALKEKLSQTTFEAGMRELEPQRQLYEIAQRIAQLKSQAMEAGPMRESQSLALQQQTMQLEQRRQQILAGMANEKARSIALMQQEAGEAKRLTAIEELQMAAAQRRALMGPTGEMEQNGDMRARYNMGMMGQQLQDVAVQLQMGTSPITIFSQQAPQMLDALGDAGLGGAFAAVGGAAVAMGKANRDAFNEMIEGARKGSRELEKLSQSTSFRDLSDGADKFTASLKTLSEARAGINGMGNTLGGIFGIFTGGDTRIEKLAKIKDAQEQAEKNMASLGKITIANSERELQIAELKAKGKEFEAGQTERQLTLERELKAIRDSQFAPDIKATLMSNAEAVADAKEQAEQTKERARREKEIEESKQKQRALVLASLKAQSDEDGRQIELRKQIADKAFEGGLKGMNAGEQEGMIDAKIRELREARYRDQGPVQPSDELRIQLEIQQLEQRKLDLQRQQNEEAQEAAENARHAAEQAEREAKARRDALAAQVAKGLKEVQSLVDEATLNHLRVHGHERQAQRLESERAMAEKVAKLEASGMQHEEAVKMARRMQRDEDRLHGRPGIIHGGRGSAPSHLIDRNNPFDDAQAFPNLNKMKNKGHLRDEMQFPGLDAMHEQQTRGRHTQAAAAQNAQAHVSIVEGQQIIAHLATIAQNLQIAA